MPEDGWAIFRSWASKGMLVDPASLGLLMMDSAYAKAACSEAGLCSMLERCSAFGELSSVFGWCAGGDVALESAASVAVPSYAMRFDVRGATCHQPPSQCRGSHAKLARLVAQMRVSGASDAATVLEAVRQHSYGEGQWLKVAGGSKANLIEHSLRARSARPGEVALEFGVFVAYSTIRIAQRAIEFRTLAQVAHGSTPDVIGMEVEPVHVCVARWMVDLAGLATAAEVWPGIAHDSLLRAGDEFGIRSARLIFMDHRGTKFHEDLRRLEHEELLAAGALVIADNVLKPSAPVFCWTVNVSPAFDAVNWALGEFVQYYVEDWMVVAVFCSSTCTSQLPPPPDALTRLAWTSDRWRRRSEEGGVRTSEWADFSHHARKVFLACGLEAKPWLGSSVRG